MQEGIANGTPASEYQITGPIVHRRLKFAPMERTEWKNKPVVSTTQEPKHSDVWLADVLHKTTELALDKDKRTLQLLSEVRNARDDKEGKAAALLKHVFGKLPWWQQGTAGYDKVNDRLFASMASHWVREKNFIGVHTLDKDLNAPEDVSELLNPASFGLTQQILDARLAQGRARTTTSST
jgi:hypothetical protein